MPLQRTIFEHLYATGEPFMLHVRRDFPGTNLPPWCEDLVPIRLEPGNPRNHQDLELDETGLCCRTAQDARPYTLTAPWASIAAMVQGETFAAAWEVREPPEPALPRPHLQLVE